MRTLAVALVLSLSVYPCYAGAAKKITLTITSEPSGATVEWNGQVVGITPFVREFDESFFKAPKWLWSGFLSEPIALRIWKEGYLGKELRLTSGPFRWVNATNTAEKIYYVINATSFRVSLEPDAVSRIVHETSASASVPAETRPAGPVQSVGTGFLLSSGAYVVTNHHVIADADDIQITFPSLAKTVAATVTVQDKINDIVILKLADTGPWVDLSLPLLRVAEQSSVKTGQSTFTLGFPLGDLMGSTARLSTGTISSLYGLRDDPRLFQISNPVQPGNSGGPLFNDSGELVGIVVAGLNAKYFYESEGIIPQNMNFAIKVGFLKNLMEMLPPADTSPRTVAGAPKGANLEKQVEILTPLIVKVTATLPIKK